MKYVEHGKLNTDVILNFTLFNIAMPCISISYYMFISQTLDFSFIISLTIYDMILEFGNWLK